MTNPSINLCLKESLTTCPNCSSVDFWPDQAKPINVKEKAIDVAFECRYCGLEALLSFKFTHASWFNSEHEDVDLGL